MIEQLLLIGQILVVVLVWIFVWRTMRSANRSLQNTTAATTVSATQDSTIFSPDDVARARRESGLAPPRLVVVSGSGLRIGQPFEIDGGGLRVGRSDDNDIVLADEFASSSHFEITSLGRISDLASTNGTLVNGSRLTAPVTLRAGDRIQVGGTEFRFEVPQ